MAPLEHLHRCLACGEEWTCEGPWCDRTLEDVCDARVALEVEFELDEDAEADAEEDADDADG
jgi:hypothetical protein